MDSLAIYFGLDSYGYNLILIRQQVCPLKILIRLPLAHFHFSWVVVLLLVMLMLLVLRFLVSMQIVPLINMHLVQNFLEKYSLRYYRMIFILLFYKIIAGALLIRRRRFLVRNLAGSKLLLVVLVK